MAIAALLETLVLGVAAALVIRGARPASPPYGRRLLAVGALLVLEHAVLYGFVWVQARTGWGIAHATPPGLAIGTQLVRVALLLLAGSVWLGIAHDQLTKRGERVALAACFVGLLGSGTTQIVAAIGMFVVLRRMKWAEAVTGWRRAVGFVDSALLLVALSFVPMTTVVAGARNLLISVSGDSWPPALLTGDIAANAELLLARPLDRMIQAIVDVFRIQLLVLATGFLFMPIRLTGMSLKRRFWFNFVLVRSIPSLLSWCVLVGVLYLAVGYTKGVRVRGALDQTLARATTAANALGDDSTLTRNADPSRLDRARRWLAPDGDSAYVVARGAGRSVQATRGTPAAILVPALSIEDTSATRGLYPRGETLYLTAIRRSERGTTEVWVPVDSTYLARTMRLVGGSARLTAQPNVFVGGHGVRITGDSAWTRHMVTARYTEPVSSAGRGRPWFLNRLYLPAGDWPKPGGAWRGGVELYLESTPRSLFRSAVGSLGGLYSNAFLLLILLALGMVLGMVEGFAVRSGKSIVQAVLDEIGTLRQAAVEFGAGNLAYRLPVKGQDEISVVATSFNDMAASLERQRQELIEAERLEEDLAVARQIQQRFLPQQSPDVPGLDVAGVSIPSKAVGGDLFYWFPHEDGSLGFVLGDVSGKSVPAALLMSNVLAALRVQALERVELSASLERANRLIIDQIEPGRFVTLFHGEADASNGTLRYVSAGHNPPLLLGANGTIGWLHEGGLPLGVLATASYRTETIPFAPGDTLIVYSDGVTEAQGPAPTPLSPGASPEPVMFGEERLASVATSLRGRPARAVLDGVLDAVRRYAEGVEQADDITIVVVRRA